MALTGTFEDVSFAELLQMLSIRVAFVNAHVDIVDQFQERPAGMSAELRVLLPVMAAVAFRDIVRQ